jgi:hypothetical protein
VEVTAMAFKIALKPLRPGKQPFARGPIEAKIEKGLTMVAADIQIDFIQSVEHWKTQVTFVIKYKKLEREIYTENKIFKYVNDGTKAHMIYPRPGLKSNPVLVFSIGGLTIFAKRVRHPGTKPQNFTRTVASDWKKKAAPIVQSFLKGIS